VGRSAGLDAVAPWRADLLALIGVRGERALFLIGRVGARLRAPAEAQARWKPPMADDYRFDRRLG